MISLILLVLAAASLVLTYAARRMRGFADEYYFPSKQDNMEGTTVQLRPVRYISVIMSGVFAYAALMTWYFASIDAISASY